MAVRSFLAALIVAAQLLLGCRSLDNGLARTPPVRTPPLMQTVTACLLYLVAALHHVRTFGARYLAIDTSASTESSIVLSVLPVDCTLRMPACPPTCSPACRPACFPLQG
eukprot:COSAG02_NODE_3759_length_6273_cov_2.503401_7_plen_110_part_00